MTQPSTYRKAEREEVQLAIDLTIRDLTHQNILDEKTTPFVFHRGAPQLSDKLVARLVTESSACGHLSPRAAWSVLSFGTARFHNQGLFVINGESRISVHKDLRARGLAGPPLPKYHKGKRIS